MQAFLQSAFLQALGYAIASSLWQVALLWLIVVLVSNIGKLSSSKKYFVAVTAQFAAFAWFIATLRFYYFHYSEALSGLQFSDAVNTAYIVEPAINNFSSAALYIIIKAELLLPYLSIAYLFMLLFLCIRFTRAVYYTREIRTKGLQKADVNLRLFVKRTASYLGIKKEVRIYFSRLVHSPLTIGFLKPLILVPVASINHLSTEQLEAVLLHELAHIKRADYLINILQSIIEITLFFNPFVQLLGKQIKHERENSCDDWVLQFQYNPAMYAEALLCIAYIQKEPSLTMNAGGNKGELLPRVKRMLNQQDKSHRYRNQVFSFLLITILLSTVAWLQPVVKKNTAANGNTAVTKKSSRIIVEPLSANVENPLFNPLFFLTEPIQKEIDKAVELAQQEVYDAQPDIENVTAMIEAVSPAILEKIQNLSLDFTRALKEGQANTNNNDENKIALPYGINVTDSINPGNVISAALLNKISKTDWQKINTEISTGINNAQKELNALGKENIFGAFSANVIKNALSQTAMELEQLKLENGQAFKKQTQLLKKAELQKIQTEKLKGNFLKLEKEINEKQKQHTEKWIEDKLNNLPNLDTDADGNEENTVSFSDIADPEQPYTAEIYAPAAYNFTNNTYRFADSAQGIQSALIVVKHNPANEKSHTKHITVEITGNNGEKKSYEFTVEVFQ